MSIKNWFLKINFLFRYEIVRTEFKIKKSRQKVARWTEALIERWALMKNFNVEFPQNASEILFDMIPQKNKYEDFVFFKGTTDGLEIYVDSNCRYEAVLLELLEKFDASGNFYEGQVVKIIFSEQPIAGILADLETIAREYGLFIVGVESFYNEKMKRHSAKTTMSWIKRIHSLTKQRMVAKNQFKNIDSGRSLLKSKTKNAYMVPGQEAKPAQASVNLD